MYGYPEQFIPQPEYPGAAAGRCRGAEPALGDRDDGRPAAEA